MSFEYKAETEIALGRIFALGSEMKPVAHAPVLQSKDRVLYLSSLGKLGRFGNQLFQFAYVSALAKTNHCAVATNDWIGRHIFVESTASDVETIEETIGSDSDCPSSSSNSSSSASSSPSLAAGAIIPRTPVHAARQSVAKSVLVDSSNAANAATVVIDEKTWTGARCVIEGDTSAANSTFTDNVVEMINKSNGNGQQVMSVGPQDLHVPREELVGTDVWGWFQINMKHYDREFFRSLFEPRHDLKKALDAYLAKLRGADGSRTVIGVHIRRGDYTSIAMTSFGYSVPTAWYLAWLDSIWSTLKNPVLFVATDDPTGEVVRDFDRFHPETLETLGASMPAEYAHLKAGFYPDFYLLSQCDYLAVSNSTFSFGAALMNTRCTHFLRPHSELGLVAFDPWQSQPILHREMATNVISSLKNTVALVHKTEGIKGCMRLLFKELPMHLVRKTILFCTIGR